MANGFDITDPTQLTASPETEANAPIPMEDLNKTQPDPNDPNVMFSEAALQRDKDFKRIDRFTKLGYSPQEIVSLIGGDDDRSHEEVASAIIAKYEIEQSEIREENEKHKLEFEQNKQEIEKRQAALEAERLKKKDLPLGPDGEPSASGLDGDGRPEAVAFPEGVENLMYYPAGQDSPSLLRVTETNSALANSAMIQNFSSEMLANLEEGDMQGAKQMFEAMEGMGLEVPEELEKTTALFGIVPISDIGDFFTGDYRGEEQGAELKETLRKWGIEQQQKSKSDINSNMLELKEAYNDLGIDYNLNPESNLDLRQALTEAIELDEDMDLRSVERAVQDDAIEKGSLDMNWMERRLLGLEKFAVGVKNIVPTIAAAMIQSGLREGLHGQEDADQIMRRINYEEDYYNAKSKKKQDLMGIEERVQQMPLGEAMRADDVSFSQVLLKTLNFTGDLAPDVLFSFATLGSGGFAKSAAKEIAKEASEAVFKASLQKTISAGLRREARKVYRREFIKAGGRKASIKMATGLSIMGGRSASSTYASVWDRSDLTQNEKLFLSSTVGLAEVTLGYLLRGAEVSGAAGVKAFISKAGGREGIKQATRDVLKKVTKKHILFQGAKDAGGEWLEEALIEVIDQGTRNMLEWSNGRKVTPIDWLAVEEAGIGGLLGTGPMAAIGTGSRLYSHSKVTEMREKTMKELESIDDQILVTPAGPTLEILKAKRKRLKNDLAYIDAKGNREYDKLTDTEKESVGELSRDMENLRNEIAEAKKNNDTDTVRELEKQFEQKLELKNSIEEAASDRQPVANSATETDSDGNEINSIQKDVTPEQKAKNDAEPTATEEQINNQEKTTESAEEAKVNKRFNSAMGSLGKHLGLTASDPENATKHKRTVKAQRTRAINLLASLDGGTPEAKAKAAETVDAYIKAKELVAQADAGAAAATSEQGRAQIEEARKLVRETEEGTASEEAAPEAETQEAVEDNSVTIESGDDIDLNSDWIGEGEGKISLAVVNQIKRLKKAFGGILDRYGIKVQVHLTTDSFTKATGKGVNTKGMYSHSTKTIHIQPRSRKSDVQEEFGHGVFRTIMSNNSKLRQEVYSEINKMTGIPEVDGKLDISEWVNVNNGNNGKSADGRGPDFTSAKAKQEYKENPALKALIDTEILYAGKKLSERQEEAIMSALTAYAANPNKFKGPKGEGVINRVIRMFNRVMKVGGYKGNYITTQDSFFTMAAKFKEATEGAVTEVETKTEDYAAPTTTEQAVPPTPPPTDQAPPTPPPAAQEAPAPPAAQETEAKPAVSEEKVDPEVQSQGRVSENLRGKKIQDLVGKKLIFEITPSHEVLREDMGEKQFVEVIVQELPGTKWGIGFTVIKGADLGGRYKSVDNNTQFSKFIDKLNEAHTIDIIGKGVTPQNIESALNSLQRRDSDSWDYGKKQNTGKEAFAPSKALSNLESGPAGMLIKLVEADAKTDDSFESRGYDSYPNLDGAEVFFTQTISRPDAIGTSKVRSVREKSIKVNDFWHFRNLYAKFTGNGQLRERMEDMYYVKDGVKYPDLQPPPPRRDRQTREVLKMDVPYIKSYQEFQGEERQKESGLTSQMSQQWSELTKEISELFRSSDKKLDLYTQERDFQPIEPSDVGFEDADALARQVESLVIAKKNIQALIDSDITAEDLNELRGGPGQVINKATNPEIFNMSGLTPFSEAQNGDIVADGEIDLSETPGDFASEDFDRGPIEIPLSVQEAENDIEYIKASDLQGYEVATSGFDGTFPFEDKHFDVRSGVLDLVNKTIKNEEGEESYVYTTHRDIAKANSVRKKLERAAKKDAAKDSPKGAVYMTFAILYKDRALGNPDIFRGLMTMYGDQTKDPSKLNDILNDLPSNLKDTLFGAMLSSVSRLDVSVSQKMRLEKMLQKTKPKLEVQSKEDMDAVMQMLAATNEEGISNEAGQTFKNRERVSKALLSAMDINKNDFINQIIDPRFRGAATNTGYIVAATKIPYTIDKNGDVQGFDVTSLPDQGFAGGLYTTSKPEGIKLLDKMYPIEQAIPSYPVKTSITEEVTDKRRRGGKKEVTYETEMPIGELAKRDPEEAAKKAKEGAGFSTPEGEWNIQNDTTQDSNVGIGQGTVVLGVKEKEVGEEVGEEVTSDYGSEDYESRGGMMDSQTDNGEFQLREKTWFQEWRGKWLRRLADKYRDVLLIQEDIEKHKGAGVKESQDFKMAEERMYGKAANDLQKLEDKTKEMTSMMKEMGLTQGEISDYMYALHAKERNALILERDGVENGSGMTDAEADAILAELDPSKKANMDKVLELVRDIQQDTRDTMVKLGLESQETIDVFEGQFENYVPLAGIAVDETDSANTKYPTGGAGMSVQGDTYKKAAGRKSQAANLLAQVIAQNASVHISGRTNEALQSLHELVSENPNSKVWKIIDKASYGDAHVVPVRINGEQKYIRFADSSYAETLKGMSVPRTSALVKMLRAPANWLRRSFTTLNPEFVISNFSRDIQSAIFNAMAEADIEGGALLGTNAVKDMMKMVAPSLKTLVRGVAGKSGDPMIEKYYADFQEDGGKTGWAYAKPLSDIAAQIEKETTDKSTAQNILGKVEAFAETIEGVNDAFENSIRLAAYIGARENGVSRGKAAQLAKNITVNFNKHGEYGQALNAVYLFFNASIQGTMRLGKSLLTMKPPIKPNGVKAEWYQRINGAQKMAAGLTVFSAMLTMIGRAMSEEDEDGILFYDKIPDYVKERNLIFMYDGKNHIKVPMPYGFNIFANLGSAAVETAAGAKEPDEAMMFLANSFMGAFSPVSFGQSKDLFTSVGKSATPTVLKPLVEIMTNETYFGGPVYAAQSPYASPKPESSMSFRSPKAIQEFFEWMNETTGGSKHVPGNVDMNPDKFWHIFDYFLGGAGQFVTRTGETAFKVGQKLIVDNDVKVEFNDIPLMRKMYGEPSKYYDFGKFKERETEIKQLVREYKQDRSEDLSRYKDLGPLNNTLKAINKQLKVLRARKREARDIGNYAERSIRIQELMDKERMLIMKFNKIYDKIRNNE
jgi:hypothetical protein